MSIVCGIYAIRNENINSNEFGLMYVGKSINIERRLKQHLNNYLNKYYQPYKIYEAFKKWGYENFKYYILEECNPEDLDKKEIFWINYYDSFNNGYNLTIGGDGGGYGEYSSLSKLKNLDVLEIKDLLLNTQISMTEIANIYGVSVYCISDINTGRSWTHVGYTIFPLRETTDYQSRICPKCSRNKNKGSNLCMTCSNEIRKSNPPNSKLDVSRVLGIKNMILNTNTKFKDIAEIYEVNPTVISEINAGRAWFTVGGYTYPLRNNRNPINYCECGNVISYVSTHCKSCTPNNFSRSNNPSQKLTEEDVLNIKKLIKDSDLTFKKIAELYDISDSNISGINSGTTWSDIGDYTYPIKVNFNPPTCNSCGVKISKSSNGLCEKCFGNSISGTRNPNCKLNEKSVMEIKNLIANSYKSLAEIGKAYGIGKSSMSRINNGETWGNVGNFEYPIR